MTLTATHTFETPSGKSRQSENFPVGSYLIRPDLRVHVHAFYTFARAADDISDHPLLEPDEKIARLNHFASILERKTEGDIKSATDMLHSLSATGITAQHCLDLLTAFKRDARQLRYDDWSDLLDYCRYSASPVGRHVLALHGIGEAAWPANDALCSALQVINHIQDCSDDYAELDRVYIPQNMLKSHGAVTEDLTRTHCSDGLRHTLDAMLTKLDEMMIQARDLPRAIPDIRLKCETAVIWTLGNRLIHLLRRRDPLRDNVKLSKFAVLGSACSGLVRAWF